MCGWQAKCEEFLQRAHDIDAASLSPEDLITLKVFKEEMIAYIQNFPYKKWVYRVFVILAGSSSYLRHCVLELLYTAGSEGKSCFAVVFMYVYR